MPTLEELREKRAAYSRARYQARKELKEQAEHDSLFGAIELVQRYWVLHLVHALAEGPKRFSVLEIELGCSAQSLGEALRTMAEHGLVTSTRYNESPPRVDHELTIKGFGLVSVVASLKDWAKTWED